MILLLLQERQFIYFSRGLVRVQSRFTDEELLRDDEMPCGDALSRGNRSSNKIR